jgi:hypothetical protein
MDMLQFKFALGSIVIDSAPTRTPHVAGRWVGTAQVTLHRLDGASFAWRIRNANKPKALVGWLA